MTFATYPEVVSPLTLSHGVLIQLLEGERPRPLDESQTNIGDAIAEGLMRLEESGENRRKVLILLSDGEHNFAGPAGSPTWTPRLAAQRAADLGYSSLPPSVQTTVLAKMAEVTCNGAPVLK